MATAREKQLTTLLLKEKLERISGKKVILKEENNATLYVAFRYGGTNYNPKVREEYITLNVTKEKQLLETAADYFEDYLDHRELGDYPALFWAVDKIGRAHV